MSFMIKSMEMFISDLARGQSMNIESLCSSTSPPQHVKLSSNPIILRRKLRTNYFFGPVCFLWNSNTGYERLILKGRASVCGNRAGLTKRSNCPVVREKETCLQHLIPTSATSLFPCFILSVWLNIPFQPVRFKVDAWLCVRVWCVWFQVRVSLKDRCQARQSYEATGTLVQG